MMAGKKFWKRDKIFIVALKTCLAGMFFLTALVSVEGSGSEGKIWLEKSLKTAKSEGSK